MSATFSHSLHLSSALEEAMVPKKQGIVSILGADTAAETERSVPFKAGASLRRTLSADMSSKKWLTQQGFSSLKKIASSNQFPVISAINDSSEEKPEQTQFDIWSSIISQKEESSLILTPPYIHPLVKRSASSLSDKSLEICTESLGSETGSDSFSASSYPPSESSVDMDDEDNKEEVQEKPLQTQPPQLMTASFDEEEEPRIFKFPAAAEYRSFPPPIPSLSRKDIGAGVVRMMKTHRDNGRLVLEAVSVPSHNNFLAQRQDGRLVLTFANTKTETSIEVEDEEEVDQELEEVFESFEEDDIEEEEETEEHRWCEMEQAPKLPSGAMNVHRLAVMMNKPIWLGNRNPTWPENFDEIVQFGSEQKEETTPSPLAVLAQSLPPRPPVSRLIPSNSQPSTVAAAAAASLNGYNHYWRRSTNQPPMSKAAAADQVQQSPPVKNLMANDHQQQQRRDSFAPFSQGCKEPRRSLLFWEPHCIATS